MSVLLSSASRRLSLIAYPLSLIFLLAACAPQVQPYVAADHPPRLDAEIFHAQDEASLPYRSWLPRGKPKAVIVALHGFNDYSRAFEEAGEYFQKRGIAVYAYDQRGFGQAPEVGIWAGRDNLVSDLRQFVAAVSKRHPGRSVYVLGESMGGAVAAVALAGKGNTKIKGMILVAPAIWGGETMPAFYRGSLWLVAHTLPFHELTGKNLKILASNNIPMLKRLQKDPLILKSSRVDSVYGLVQLMDDAYYKVTELEVPVLLLYGSKDQVIPKEPIERALARFGSAVTYAHYPEGYHMLLRDLQGEEVMEDIAAWIGAPGKPLPSGFGAGYIPSGGAYSD